MKFKNRNGVVFFDTDWIAGVDYEEDDIEDEDDEDASYQYEAKEDENMEYGNIDPEEVEAVNYVSGVDLLVNVAMDAQKGNIKPCYF
jgi:hypothetical protein